MCHIFFARSKRARFRVFAISGERTNVRSEDKIMAKLGSILRKTSICAAAALMVGSFTAAQLISLGGKNSSAAQTVADTGTTITDVTGKVASDLTASFDPEVVRKLPEGIDPGREISVIVRTTDSTLVTAYDAQNGISRYGNVSAFADSAAGEAVLSRIERENNKALSRLKGAGVKYELGATYNTILGGFELVVEAREYEKIVSALDGTDALPSISEEYAPAEAQLVENDVNVYETGIFDSSESAFKGEGTLIAVLDTGFDYTHSVFDPNVFAQGVDESKLYMTKDRLSGLVGDLEAAKYTRGLSPEKVYVNDKIPYAYDYADKDTDVYPLDSEHGTHVAGIILGNNVGAAEKAETDPEIVGVAPLAQLAAMKVFSDTTSGARQSWLLAAVEDCVKLGVDVINMSLGMSSGFTVTDDEAQRTAYENVGKAGISLVAAASNDYNSTFGSEKNGNLGLTSNPDSSTVGSPSTYESALSVASISGVKTSYMKYGNRIIYFTQAVDVASEPMDFVNEILPAGEDTKEFEYVTVPGIGSSQDYIGLNMAGKIALVRRGTNSFEEKAKVALDEMGAAGVIIYNNVSGDISMTVGNTKGAICSISQDDGEVLAANSTGKITISRSQMAGPFMSDFSSWGPTPDLRIKPEITAHGGDILSAVPGQKYDRLSGTSMASPNQAGVVAILREYVKQKFGLTQETDEARRQVTALANRIMMSTADIAYNDNGLPYAVRKQGAGLVNLNEALTTPAYITTYARNDEHLYDGSPRFIVDAEHELDKTKLEYGDDRDKTGVYELVFSVNNFSGTSLTYDIGALVQTEGVSETLTVRGDTTVTEKGYALSPKITVTEVDGTAHSGNSVTVAAGKAATVTVRIALTDSDRQYLDRSFANGMYVEGYVTLGAKKGTEIGLNVPFLAFYGDWTQAPLFDLDYFETNPDELDDGIDPDDKTMADAYATQPIGSLYDDYINYLGSFPFNQDPASKKVAATRSHIALTNQTGRGGGVNGISAIWAGMLRSSKYVDITITDTTTGEVIWSKTENNVRKTYSSGSNFYNSTVEVGFNVPEYDLKNNTRYMVRLEGYLDYGDKGTQRNARNVFEFPFTADFQAPVVTGVEFYTEIDKTDKTAPFTRTYARLSVFDNHYAAAAFFGYMKLAAPGSEYMLEMPAFSNYATAINASSANSTTEVTIELTDHMKEIATAAHPNTFTVQLYDYALNNSTFEIKVPYETIQSVTFTGDNVTTDENQIQTITLIPNQRYIIDPTVYPDQTEWANALDYAIAEGGEGVAKIVGNKLIGVAVGETELTVSKTVTDPEGEFGATTTELIKTVKVKVCAPEELGMRPLDPSGVSSFRLTSYTTDNAYYFLSSEDREIGETGDTTLFPANTSTYVLSMYPSERVTVAYELLAYADDVEVVFRSNNSRIATVSGEGQIEAFRRGSTSIEVSVKQNNRTLVSAYITVIVKDPYERNGPFLTGFRGVGEVEMVDGVPTPTGTVDIGKDLGADHGLTTIEQFAFSHYDFIPKGPDDVIDEEDPYNSKIWYLGENDHIKKIIIPEGVEVINMYAFAGMEGLEEVVLPSTLKHIGVGAFLGCTSLRTVQGLEHVQLINQDAFRDTDLQKADLSSVIAVGNYAFANTKLAGKLELPVSAQSIGAYAFSGIKEIDQLIIHASTVKLGEGAFSGDTGLTTIPAINAANIPENLFRGDENLTSITLGKDVESVDRNAFKGTGISEFNVAEGNSVFRASEDKKSLFRVGGGDEVELLCVVPTFSGKYTDATVTKVGSGAFAGADSLTYVELPNATAIGESAFFECRNLATVRLGNVTDVAAYAFAGTRITRFDFSKIQTIGDHAFYGASLNAVELPDGTQVGSYAFAACANISSVVIGSGAVIGDHAFANEATLRTLGNPYRVSFSDGSIVELYEVGHVADTTGLTTLKTGENVEIGAYAFAYQMALTSVKFGQGTSIGDSAFVLTTSLSKADLAGVVSIGPNAFAGELTGIAEREGTSGNYTYNYYSENFGLQAGGVRSVTLTSATAIGERAFAYNTALTTVELGEDLHTIAPYAFYGTRIAKIDLGNIETVGDYAFGAHTSEIFFTNQAVTTYSIGVSELDLSKAASIGAHAFEEASALTRITLPAPAAEGEETKAAGLVIGDYAFAGASHLSEAVNLELATRIGAHAFEHSALTGELDLSKVVSIGDWAFAYNSIGRAVLGKTLTEIGDNPFAGNPTVFTSAENQTTYDISENVFVSGGVLYRKRVFEGGDLLATRSVDGTQQNYLYGLELIAYPATAEDEAYAVEEGTVRIAAGAFMNAGLERVTLPDSLAAIGDKAFYGANALSIVIFKGFNAPILEEQYDPDYQIAHGEDANLPGPYIQNDLNPSSDGESDRELGILPYGMWFVDATTYFYGANFVDYIGKAAGDLLMIRPKNGLGYENFIYGQYFELALDGPAAPNDSTRAVIRAITLLPEPRQINESNYAEIKVSVQAARALYDAITSDEQRALITNYQKLRNAEDAIKMIEGENTDPGTEEPAAPADITTIALAVTCGILGAAVIVMAAIILARFKGEKRAETADDDKEGKDDDHGDHGDSNDRNEG